MKRIVLMLSFLMLSSAFATTYVTAKSAKVNVRDNASTKNSKVVGSITNQKTYAVEETTTDDQGREWYKIKEGYVAAWVMKKTPVKNLSIHGDKNMSDEGSNDFDDTSSPDETPSSPDSNLDSDGSFSDDDAYDDSDDASSLE